MRTKAMVIALTSVMMALLACEGPPGSPNTPDQPSDDLTGRAFDADRPAPAAEIDGAASGGTIRYLSSAAVIPTLDPATVYNPEVLSIMRGLVERSLTQYVFDAEQGGMVLVPDIATDLGTPNDDFSEWTFTIRDGVRFEDGSEVTADDVAYGIKRSFDHRNLHSPPYSSEYFLGGDSYKGPYVSGTGYDGIVVHGETLTFKMERPFPDLPYWAAFPAMGPVRQEGSTPPAYGQHPMATGPYKVSEFTPQKSLVLVRNGQWDPDTDPGRHQYPDRFVFRLGVDPRDVDATILGDSVLGQTTLSSDSVQADHYETARDLERVAVGPVGCTVWLAPNYREFTDINVRRAIGFAVPRGELAKANGLVLDVTALPGGSILPPGFPGRVVDSSGPQGWSADPDRARALLAEAGFAPGEITLKFTYVKDDPVRRHALVDAFEAAGFAVDPFLTTADQQYDVQVDPRAPINLRSGGWCPDWPAGVGWSVPFGSHSGSGANLAYFSEPAVDARIDEISKLPLGDQPPEWGALYQTINADFYPVIVTYYLSVAMPFGSKVGGMNVGEQGAPTWKDLYVMP